jgi:hypothetical protein
LRLPFNAGPDAIYARTVRKTTKLQRKLLRAKTSAPSEYSHTSGLKAKRIAPTPANGLNTVVVEELGNSAAISEEDSAISPEVRAPSMQQAMFTNHAGDFPGKRDDAFIV